MKIKRLSLSGILAALLLAGPALAAPLVEFAPETSQDAASFQELKQIEEILAKVSKLRALPVVRPIQVGLLDRSQLQHKLTQQIAEEIPADKLRGEAALYHQLGMLPAGFDYKTFLIDLYTEQIGGFYDPKTRELKLIKGTPLTGLDQQLLISHELTHALQDQRYDLNKFLNSDSGNDDRSLAQMALIEGDATVSASEYIQSRASAKPLQGLLEVLGSAFNAARQIPGFEKFRSAPAFIRDSLIFPYDQGAQFVNAFRQQGWSWEDLDVVYTNPPQATEHILHPDSYLDGENPTELTLSQQPLLPGSKLLTGSVWGELGYRQFLAHHLGGKPAKEAAAGWRGDRYEVLETPSGIVFVMYSLWDSEPEARGFFSAWRSSLAKRDPKAAPMPATGGTLPWGPDQKHLIWAETSGNAVAIVENLAPEQASLIPALRAAWQQELKELKAKPNQPLKRSR